MKNKKTLNLLPGSLLLFCPTRKTDSLQLRELFIVILLFCRLLRPTVEELKANLKASDSFHHQVLIGLTLSIF